MTKIKLFLISHIGRWLLMLINRTLTYRTVGYYYYEKLVNQRKKMILSCWHNGIFMGTYFWKNKDISVLVSKNFDGEYTARIIEKLGYHAVRGSSSRGGVEGLLEIKKELEAGRNVCFTVDGPRGPKYKVQSGALWLASKTHLPILPFIAYAERKFELKSWDSFQVPYPFSTVWIIIGNPLHVGSIDIDEKLEEYRQELETNLLQLIRFADHCAKLSIEGSVKSEHSC